MVDRKGGEPITLEIATALRRMVFGSSTFACKQEWINTAFTFNPPDTTFSYGLVATKNSTKGVLMCVQAFVLKNLLFQSKGPSKCSKPAEEMNLLKPSRSTQQEALWRALTDIIWKCGSEEGQCVVCVGSDIPHVSGDIGYAPDGITEKIMFFKFLKQEDLCHFLEKNIHDFQEEENGGLLKLVYSALLSRGLEKVREDQSVEPNHMVSNIGEIHTSLLSLLLTGRATTFLHNGIANISEGATTIQQVGICIRSEIGLLYFKKDDNSKEVGSRMKTPMYPVWVTAGNDQYGVLFNPSRDLLRDHKAEHMFNLHYYNSSPELSKTTVLTIDTRFCKVSQEEELKKPILEKLILTKWQGATVNWNGAPPVL